MCIPAQARLGGAAVEVGAAAGGVVLPAQQRRRRPQLLVRVRVPVHTCARNASLGRSCSKLLRHYIQAAN